MSILTTGLNKQQCSGSKIGMMQRLQIEHGPRTAATTLYPVENDDTASLIKVANGLVEQWQASIYCCGKALSFTAIAGCGERIGLSNQFTGVTSRSSAISFVRLNNIRALGKITFSCAEQSSNPVLSRPFACIQSKGWSHLVALGTIW